MRFKLPSDSETKSFLLRYHRLNQEEGGSIIYINNQYHLLEQFFIKEPIKPNTFISNYLPLIELPKEIQIEVDRGEVDFSKVVAIGRIEEKELIERAFGRVKDEKLSYDESRILSRLIREAPESVREQAVEVPKTRLDEGTVEQIKKLKTEEEKR